MNVFQLLPEISDPTDNRIEVPLLPKHPTLAPLVQNLIPRFAFEITHDPNKIFVVRV